MGVTADAALYSPSAILPGAVFLLFHPLLGLCSSPTSSDRSIIFVVFFHEFFEIFQTFHIISSTNTDSYISSFLILIPATTSC